MPGVMIGDPDRSMSVVSYNAKDEANRMVRTIGLNDRTLGEWYGVVDEERQRTPSDSFNSNGSNARLQDECWVV